MKRKQESVSEYFNEIERTALIGNVIGDETSNNAAMSVTKIITWNVNGLKSVFKNRPNVFEGLRKVTYFNINCIMYR